MVILCYYVGGVLILSFQSNHHPVSSFQTISETNLFRDIEWNSLVVLIPAENKFNKSVENPKQICGNQSAKTQEEEEERKTNEKKEERERGGKEDEGKE